MKSYVEELNKTKGIIKNCIENNITINSSAPANFKNGVDKFPESLSRIIVYEKRQCDSNLTRLDVGRLSGVILGYWCINLSGYSCLKHKEIFDKMATDIIMKLYK